MPKRTAHSRSWRNGAMLLVVVGKTFTGELTPTPVDRTPPEQPPNVRPRQGGHAPGRPRAAAWKVGFPLQIPTVIERTSVLSSEVPYRVYKLDKGKTVRFTFAKSGNEYWGIQETDWNDAPALADKNLSQVINGRQYDFYLQRAAPAHGRPPRRRCDLLGREHAPRLDVERDDARDRQGPASRSTSRVARVTTEKPTLGVFGAGWVGLVTGACFADLGHDVVIRDVVAGADRGAERGSVPFHEPGLAELIERNRERLTFTLDVAESHRRRRLLLRLRRHSADALGRRGPVGASGRSSRTRRSRGRDARHEEHRAGRHG